MCCFFSPNLIGCTSAQLNGGCIGYQAICRRLLKNASNGPISLFSLQKNFRPNGGESHIPVNVNRERELYSPYSQDWLLQKFLQWVATKTRAGQGSPPLPRAFLGDRARGQNPGISQVAQDAVFWNTCSQQGNFKHRAGCSGPCALEFWISPVLEIHSLWALLLQCCISFLGNFFLKKNDFSCCNLYHCLCTFEKRLTPSPLQPPLARWKDQ